VPSKIHHIAVEVADAAQSTQFYCELLGFTKTAEYHFEDRGRRIVFLNLDGVCLELLEDEGVEAFVEAPPKQAGYKHLCLLSDDVDAECAKLKAAGATVTTEPFDTALNSRICFVQDPDGLTVELWQELG